MCSSFGQEDNPMQMCSTPSPICNFSYFIPRQLKVTRANGNKFVHNEVFFLTSYSSNSRQKVLRNYVLICNKTDPSIHYREGYPAINTLLIICINTQSYVCIYAINISRLHSNIPKTLLIPTPAEVLPQALT